MNTGSFSFRFIAGFLKVANTCTVVHKGTGWLHTSIVRIHIRVFILFGVDREHSQGANRERPGTRHSSCNLYISTPEVLDMSDEPVCQTPHSLLPDRFQSGPQFTDMGYKIIPRLRESHCRLPQCRP